MWSTSFDFGKLSVASRIQRTEARWDGIEQTRPDPRRASFHIEDRP